MRGGGGEDGTRFVVSLIHSCDTQFSISLHTRAFTDLPKAFKIPQLLKKSMKPPATCSHALRPPSGGGEGGGGGKAEVAGLGVPSADAVLDVAPSYSSFSSVGLMVAAMTRNDCPFQLCNGNCKFVVYYYSAPKQASCNPHLLNTAMLWNLCSGSSVLESVLGRN